MSHSVYVYSTDGFNHRQNHPSPIPKTKEINSQYCVFFSQLLTSLVMINSGFTGVG